MLMKPFLRSSAAGKCEKVVCVAFGRLAAVWIRLYYKSSMVAHMEGQLLIRMRRLKAGLPELMGCHADHWTES